MLSIFRPISICATIYHLVVAHPHFYCTLIWFLYEPCMGCGGGILSSLDDLRSACRLRVMSEPYQVSNQ